jgi:tetratricopeptide (TPR) repeat protein
MQIIHKLDNFLFTLFPELDRSNKEKIISELENYYSYGPFKPKVTIVDDWVKIDIDTTAIISQEADFRKSVSLCEKGNFSEAKPILNKLIEKNPTYSEYYRILGQVYSEEGDQEEAINCLINSLRWDSKNSWALLMMGNIFAKYKNDIITAKKYYDQALVVNPKDNITINNIGANLMQQGKVQEAKEYFLKAIDINDKYPNTHFALAMVAEIEKDLNSAFNNTIRSIQLNKNKDVLYQNSIRNAFELSEKVIKTGIGKAIFKKYLNKLEFEGERVIDIKQDESIPTAAKFEFAENYNRNKHLVLYKPSYPAIEHLIVHELVHLDFVIQARKVGINQIFYTSQSHKSEFIAQLEPSIKNYKKMNFSEETIAKVCSDLFEGLNSQVYNTPIDLFIENYIYEELSELKPYQFISLFNMIKEGINAVTDKNIVKLSPKEVLSKSKIYNIVNALQFKDLYGIDMINEFKATTNELKIAKDFYDEYLEYKVDREPAEEYELVAHWAEDLGVNKFFELEGEIQYRKRSNIDTLLESIEKDPFDIEDRDPIKERDMQKFLDSQKNLGLNMAVVMFMVDAMQFFDGMDKEAIKKIAFEIAMQGTQGYNPERKNYTINSIPNKKFSGYHILAYYYVSWALAIPEMLSQLPLPYEEEFKMALTMFKQK